MGQVKKCKDSVGHAIFLRFRNELKLSLKEIAFVAEYTRNGFNGTAAFMSTIARKNASRDSASVQACELVKIKRVRDAVGLIVESYIAEKKTHIEQQILRVLYARAFYDPDMFLDRQGRFRHQNLSDIPEQWRCCIDGIETKAYGKNAERLVTTYKLADREKAAEKLAKYIGMFKETAPTVNINITRDTRSTLEQIFNNGVHDRALRAEVDNVPVPAGNVN